MAHSVKLDDDTIQRLEKLGAARDRSTHWLIKDAVTTYVEREEKLELFLAEARESAEHYTKTGLHVTGEEMDEWFNKIAAGDLNAELPECHA